MRFRVTSALRYEIRAPTTFILAIQLADGAGQEVREETFSLPAGIEPDFYVDVFAGNRFARFLANPGSLEVAYTAVVDRPPDAAHARHLPATPVWALPLNVLPYLSQSRYCESDRLAAFATDMFGGRSAGLDQVNAVVEWIAANVTYESGATGVGTSATHTLIDRRGVCRDFAHLGVALCRALDMPARFISCYAWKLQPQDFHAAFQVYLDGRWMTFDATRLAPLAGLLPIGFGRDAADVPFAALFGQATMEMMTIDVQALDVAS